MTRIRDMLRSREKLTDLIGLICAAFMLCAVPLLFRNAFFDINRFKVQAVCTVMPAIVLLMLLCRRDVSFSRMKDFIKESGGPAVLLMVIFLLACVLSCALAGFEPDVITGDQGRYCGLAFMLCCGAAFLIISCLRAPKRLVLPLMIFSALIAALGFANAMGLDPLGFYRRIQRGQEHVYLSTIGHLDFFGAYLIMLFPVAGGQFVFSDNKRKRFFSCICAVSIALGASVSRTDSAFAGLHLGCMMLLALSGDHYDRMLRAFLLWSAGFLSLPVSCALLGYSIYQPAIDGLPGMLFEYHAAEALCILMLLCALICALLKRCGVKAPGRKRLFAAVMVLFLVLAAILLGVMLYFSLADTDYDLGAAASFLRFNDSWGSLRGFAYIRSLRAFADYGIVQKLFGAGMERTLQVLTPYFDDPAMLVGGVFNDPHCQPLQMLLTCGLFGMAAFVLFYAAVLLSLLRSAGDDPLCCGVLASVWAYSIVMLINVTQPILIATYFSVSALGISALREKQTREVLRDES